MRRPLDAALDQRHAGSAGAVGADRVVGIVALHGVVGEREVARSMRANGPRWSRLATKGNVRARDSRP